MSEMMEIDVNPKRPSLKRKREKQKLQVLSTPEERESKLKSLNEELESLFRYFDEVLSTDVGLSSHLDSVLSSRNTNAMIALLLVEKRSSCSKLVAEIYEKLKERDAGVTIASVKRSVLYVGQRMAYGVPSAEADVLEDESESCLWCWEIIDKKLLPSSVRSAIRIRHTCRKKIHERITAISDVISSLQKPEDHPTYITDITRAVAKFNKVLTEADIRLFLENSNQKNDSEWADKEAKKKETTIIKELEKNKQKEEKEKKRMDRELQKEKLQNEKERKRLQQEAEKDEKRREKEESELRKQLKRKQEEADRQQRRKEKEEAVLKEQLEKKRLASFMERFIIKRSNTTSQSDQSPKEATSNQSPIENALESVSLKMDSAFQCQDEIDVDEIRKSHMSSWRCLGHSIRSNQKQQWGLRHKPKTALYKELKLSSNEGPASDDDFWKDNNIVAGWGQMSIDDKSCQANTSTSLGTSKYLPRKQLLQFDKSHRPAFYGLWPNKSCVIGPRHPLKKDPELDYDIDSDEEWEEEEPGESLSDSEKEEEENLDEGSLKDDEDDESEDEFFVPDGYLSENEGVNTDRSQSNVEVDVTNSSLCKAEVLNEEYSAWMRQQKCLYNLTEHALKKNQPLIIVNMVHDKASLLSAKDLTDSLKREQLCLQALSIRACPGELSIEVPSETNLQNENQETCLSNSKSVVAGTGVSSTIPDSDLPKIVSIIQSCPQGINKVLESLQQCFPGIPKTHLKNKIREISTFIDNRWKVKKEILVKLGMSSSPEKTGKRTQSIATFFSKRCLPPSGNVVNLCETSPQSMKTASSSQQPQLQEQSENM